VALLAQFGTEPAAARAEIARRVVCCVTMLGA
jgi:hypothetical protein